MGTSLKIGGYVEENCGFGNRSEHFRTFFFRLLILFVCGNGSRVKNLDFVSVGIDTHWGSIGQTLGFFIRLDTTFNWSWSGTTHLPLISDHQYYRCLIVYLHGRPYLICWVSIADLKILGLRLCWCYCCRWLYFKFWMRIWGKWSYSTFVRWR